MTFWCGSWSADPCLWLMDPDSDPDPSIFIIDLQDANKKQTFFNKFSCILLFEGTFTLFFNDKKSKRSHKTVWIKVFLLYINLMIEGSGSSARSGSIPLTNGSGSRRPKNMWRWIRIRNTDIYRRNFRNYLNILVYRYLYNELLPIRQRIFPVVTEKWSCRIFFFGRILDELPFRIRYSGLAEEIFTDPQHCSFYLLGWLTCTNFGSTFMRCQKLFYWLIELFFYLESPLQDCWDVHLKDWKARPRQGSHGRPRHFHR